jgi:fido (protein-threonine AMPylation protein)
VDKSTLKKFKVFRRKFEMSGYKYRCCAKTLKGTRCKLSNSFTGKFCHIHAHNEPAVEAEVEAPVESVVEAAVAEVAEVEQFLHDFTEKIAETYGEPVDIHPQMDDNTWELILNSAMVDKEEFKEALEWAIFEELQHKTGTRKFDFVFHKSFPPYLHRSVFSFQGDDMQVSLNQGQLRVQTSFSK